MAHKEVYPKILIINEWTLTHFSCVSLTKRIKKSPAITKCRRSWVSSSEIFGKALQFN